MYILYSRRLEKFYVGTTAMDPKDRLQKHLTRHGGFTSQCDDWEIVYCEKFEDKSSALKREREIKSWKSSVRIKKLVAKK